MKKFLAIIVLFNLLSFIFSPIINLKANNIEDMEILLSEKHRNIKSCDINKIHNFGIDGYSDGSSSIKLDNIYNTITFNNEIKNIEIEEYFDINDNNFKHRYGENSIYYGGDTNTFYKIYNNETNIPNIDEEKIGKIRNILNNKPSINIENANINNYSILQKSDYSNSIWKSLDIYFEKGSYEITTYHYTIDNDYNIIKKEKKIININIDPNELCLENRLIEIKKIDNKTKEPLEGGEFEVYKSVPKDLTTTSKSITNKDKGYENIPDDEKFIYIKNIITDNEGKAEFNEHGHFILKEIKAPKGYKLPENINNTIYNIPGNNCPVALAPNFPPAIPDTIVTHVINPPVIIGSQGNTEIEVVGTNTCNKEPFIIEIENEKEVKKSNILIQYFEKKTGEKISDDKRIEGNIGENYSTEKIEITNYNFVSVEGNENGKFTEEEIIIKYFYNKILPNISATEDKNKIPNDKGGEIPVLTNDNFNGNTPTPDNVTITIVGEPRIPVTVNDEGKVIVPPTTETGIFTFEYKICDKNNPENCSTAPVNVDLYEEPKSTPPEAKKGKVIINFLDKETSEKISEDKTIEGKVGENYLTEKIEILNYIFNYVEGNENGIFTEGETIIKYFYDKIEKEAKKSTILVQHFDKETSEKLLEDKTYYGIVGEIYSIVKMSFDGYVFDSIEGKENGVYEENEITIKYFYTKIKTPTPPKEEPKKSTILIQYLDKDNRDKISEDKIIKGNIGDKYSTEKIEIANYTFDFVEGNEDGVYEENKITIKYFYTKIKNTTPKKPNLGGTPTTNVTLEEDPRVIIPEPPKETPKIEETPKEPEVPLESAPEEPFDFDPVPPMGEEPEILLPKVLPKTGAKEIAFFLLSLFSAYFIINRRLFIKK